MAVAGRNPGNCQLTLFDEPVDELHADAVRMQCACGRAWVADDHHYACPACGAEPEPEPALVVVPAAPPAQVVAGVTWPGDYGPTCSICGAGVRPHDPRGPRADHPFTLAKAKGGGRG